MKGIVEDVYENMIKVRVETSENPDSIQYEWFDQDCTSLQVDQNGEIKEEEPPSPNAEDESATHDDSTDELSVHPNTSPNSMTSLE